MHRVFVVVIASSIAMSAAIAGTVRQQSGWVVIDTHYPFCEVPLHTASTLSRVVPAGSGCIVTARSCHEESTT